MKCLVFSDSHGNNAFMKTALSMNRDAEVVFFLGDGLSDVELLAYEDAKRKWIVVKGNCDFHTCFCGEPVSKTEEIHLEGRKILLTHGDLYNVKYGFDVIKRYAMKREADIVLFGHTHTKHEEYVNGDKPFYLFNPGSISSNDYSFGILTLTENSVLFSIGLA